jgi:tripartite-type tricarboxylate transporter receptor subunit TctC
MTSLRTLAAALAAAALTSIGATAQDYPTKTITLVVPFAAGGPTDAVSRIIAENMQKTLGQTIVIENQLGAGGTTASTRVKESPPDGYTLITGHMGTHAASVAMYANLKYNPATDFEPIGMIAGTPVLILAKKDFPPKDLKEFAEYVKANGAKLNMAHAGVGSVSDTSCLMLNHILGVKPQAIPYQGTGPAMTALVAGQVDYMCDQIINVVPQVQAGTIKAYAVAIKARSPALPNVPTTTEAGLPEFQVTAWNALFAPKGTPKPIVDKLNAALGKALDDPGTRKRLLDLGSELPEGESRSSAALGELVKSEIARWTPIIKAARPTN